MEEVNNMTISQIKMLLAAATKKAAMDQIQFISGVALGAQASGKDIRKSVSQLEKAIEEI
jgi:hypothetical protein